MRLFFQKSIIYLSISANAAPAHMFRTAIHPVDQQPKQTGAYESAEAQELLVSLAQAEPRISQTFLYDEKGSALYEKIVEQKEYAHHRRLAATVATALAALVTALTTTALAAGTTWSRRRVRSWRGTWTRSPSPPPPRRRLVRPSRSSGSSSSVPARVCVENTACVASQPHGSRWPRLAEAIRSLWAALGTICRSKKPASSRRLSHLAPDTGAGHRTHPLVNAMAGHAARTTYSPTDISPSALEENRRYFDAACYPYPNTPKPKPKPNPDPNPNQVHFHATCQP